MRRQGVMYLPIEQQFERRLVFSVRTAGKPEDFVGDLRKTITGAAPDLGIEAIGTGLAVAGPSSVFAQITASVSGALGGFGLVLALAGLYGLLSHVVSRRTREIGVRLALGASPNQIQRLMLREGLSPVLLGVIMGAGLAVMARLSLQPRFTFLVPAMDVIALGVVPLLLLAAGALASIVPARRAARVNPNVALRDL
jgi:ABC-type antimicrobial peptide transport system permease subunit